MLDEFKLSILRVTPVNVAASVAIFLLAGPFLLSQQTTSSPEPSTAVPSSASPSTHTIIITARMKDASRVLTPTDLEIKEDGNPATVTAVRKLGRVPLHYCLVFDSSTSLAAEFSLQQKQAIELLTHAINPGSDHGWVVLFDTVIQQSTETSNPNQIMDVIAKEKPGGGTSLYDAMGSCADRMLKSPADRGLRLMFLFTDGEDNASHITHDKAAEIALRTGVRIYAFAPAPNSAPERGDHTLTVFSKMTGGRIFHPFGGMKHEIDQLSSDLEGLVEVTYASSTGSDGRQHSLEVKPREKGLQILAPEKYFASSN